MTEIITLLITIIGVTGGLLIMNAFYATKDFVVRSLEAARHWSDLEAARVRANYEYDIHSHNKEW